MPPHTISLHYSHQILHDSAGGCSKFASGMVRRMLKADLHPTPNLVRSGGISRNSYCVIADAERDGTSPMGAFCRGRGDRGGCAKDGLSWWGCPTWVTGVGLALSVLPRTAKLAMLHVIGNEKENLRAEVDSRENCLIVRLFGLFDCHWCYSTFKRRSATPRTQTQQAPAPVATQD